MWTRLSQNTINQLAHLDLQYLSFHPLLQVWIKMLLKDKKKFLCLLNYAQTAAMGVRYTFHLHFFFSLMPSKISQSLTYLILEINVARTLSRSCNSCAANERHVNFCVK